MKYNIDIDAPIGGWYISSRYIKDCLNKLSSEKEISVRISSPGGSVDHALNIHQQFKDHGNVTAFIYGMTASAATIIAMGCKKIKMSKYAFFLIHRCSTWIDEWGQMNEEQIEEAIKRLENSKENQQKIDLTLAKIYADRTGKSLEEIHNIMSQEKWLNAEDALKLGLVDEIIEEGKQASVTQKTANMFAAMGVTLPDGVKVVEENTISERIMDSISEGFNEIKRLFGNKIENNSSQNNIIMNDKFKFLMAAMALQAIDIKDGAASITEGQLGLIENQLKTLTDSISEHLATIAKRDEEIADLKKQIENLKKQPGDDGGSQYDDNGQEIDDLELARTLYNNLQ